jgi:hypothetical protein
MVYYYSQHINVSSTVIQTENNYFFKGERVMYNNNKNNSNKFNNKPAKPVTKQVPIVMTGNAGRGKKYDPNTLRDLLIDLTNSECFDKLSVMATLPKSLVFNNEEARGSIGVARVNSYDANKDEITITFYGKNLAYADLVNDSMVMVARVHSDRSGVVDTVMSFDIVNANDAE